MRRVICFGLVLFVATAPAFSQQPAATPKKQTPTSRPKATVRSSADKNPLHKWKTYCSEEAEYCVSYPPDWDVLGDVMEGNGIVMAPPQDGKEKALWNQITVSVTDLPQPENGEQAPSFDDIVSVALHGLPGKNVQTLQRSQLALHGRDAELIKVQYDDAQTNQPWVEEIVFIDDDLAIYAIALRATPNDVTGLEETFRRVVASWRPSEPEGSQAPSAKPKPPATKAPPKTPPSR